MKPLATVKSALSSLKSDEATAPTPPQPQEAEPQVDDMDLTSRLMSHPVQPELPEVFLMWVPATPHDQRIEIAERLLRAYNLATSDPLYQQHVLDKADGNMWATIQAQGLAELVSTVETGDPAQLADYLETFGNSFLWFGGITTCIDGYNRDLDEARIALTYWDSLVRIAEFLGVSQVESPETGPWGDALHQDVDQLVDKIEARLGISIRPPLGAIHTDGLKIKDSALHYRHSNSLYAAIRVNQLANVAGGKGHVLEIGGGIGIAALYANRLGLKNYTLLDIPITNLLCGNYLLKTAGTDAVRLLGEDMPDASIDILPYWKAQEIEKSRFDVCINQDSINELDDETREFYRQEIKRLVRGYFLSVNHECFYPKTAYSVFSGDPDYMLLSRSPYWPRAGYVEELYKIDES